MSEQASKVLIDLLEKASSGIDSAVAFSQAQIPEVISQLLAWKMAMGIIWFAFGLATIASAVFIPLWAGRQRRKGALWTYYNGDARFNLSSISYDFIRTPFPLGLLFYWCTHFSCELEFLAENTNSSEVISNRICSLPN